MTSKRDTLERVAGPVSRETFDSLVELERQLIAWNKRVNLVSNSTIEDAWSRHILDGAQLIRLAEGVHRWGDLGSGGGFPGLVIGVMMRGRSGASVTLVESNAKKTAFLQHVSGLLGLSLDIRSERIEEALFYAPAPEIVTARALAPLPKLLELASPWLVQSTGLFHKGRDYRREVEESADKFDFDLIEHASSVDRDSVILEISNLSKRR